MRAWWLILLLVAPAFAQQPDATPAKPPYPTPGVIWDVTDRPPPMREHKTGFAEWADFLVRGTAVTRCGIREASCTLAELIVENRTDKVLTCGGMIEFEQPNAHGIQNVLATNVVVQPRARTTIAGSVTPINMAVTASSLCMTNEKPAQAAATAIVECYYKVIGSVDIDAFYPPAARAERREGKVYLEFTIPELEGKATGIAVYKASAYPDLDAAGVEALGAAKFTTNCEGRRYRAAIKFSFKP